MTISLAWGAVGLACLGMAALAGYATLLIRRLKTSKEELEQLKAQILEWNRLLEQKVAQRAADLETAYHNLQKAYLETVTALVEAMTAKDTYLFSHSHAVAAYAKSIAQEMDLSKEKISRLMQGCELHDLGKIAVPDQILMKAGPLTKEEFEVVKQHPIWGARILGPLTFMKDITEMVRQEHERWDGTGYPDCLKGDQIRLEARIISVADALDAMTSNRPYRSKLSLEEASLEIKRCAGTQFDPAVAEAALRAIRKGALSVLSDPHIPRRGRV